ncbi:MAG TPA: CHAT domain-containing protein [Thermoanaerobaculia bacterium]|jgi:hypothetical protein
MATRPTTAHNGWTLRRTTGAAKRRGAAAAAPENPIPPEFLQADARVEEVYEAMPPPAAAARRTAPPDLIVQTDLAPGEAAVLAVRHPSGALTFHPSTETAAPSARRRSRTSPAPAAAVFRVPVRRVGDGNGRRSVITKAIKIAVVKVAKKAADKVVGIALPILARKWEERTWKKKGLSEGWFHVAPGAGSLTLTPSTPPAGARSLLLLHGTFSNANGAFRALTDTDFFDRVRPLYGDRIYAFNHFSVSRTPEENADQLLQGLPEGEYTFDAITHSRGGLVLRNLVEPAGSSSGAAAGRFRMRHAVLVACPNDGTPLATPTRWEETVGWFANLMEIFPDNPFTTGAEFVSEALVWLATHLASDLPGLRSMDGAGDMVEELQSPPGPPAEAYSALVSNFHPDEKLWQRALDVGVDGFFASANDLVVPSEGGWRTDREGASHVPASRIGCFGPGGNLGTGTVPVHHVNFFARSETAQFLANALAGTPHNLPAIDPGAPLPDRRFTRRGAAVAVIPADRVEVLPASAVVPSPSTGRIVPQYAPQSSAHDDSGAFHIVIMPAYDDPNADAPPAKPKWARVLATYGGARVMASMRLRADEGEPPTSFGRIIAFHDRIQKYTNEGTGTLPGDADMIRFGGLLFETLFQGDVRRLYDEARARQRGRKLDLVLTSLIPWVAEKPWEFCYDTSRQSFLATEEIHFVRNVLTAIPADPIVSCDRPLRILVAWAQPVSFGLLSIDQEEEMIRRGFQPLVDAGLVTIEVLPRATPEALHRKLENRSYNVVHFIGHGVFDEMKGEGFLVFEDDRGGEFRLSQRSVREIFCGRGLSLVFLNSCQSGTGGRADFNKGVAQSMIAHGLPALVANQYSVLDSSATSFAQYFYSSLAQGHTLGHAAREARIAVNYSMNGELIDWAIPVLYARDANQALCAASAGAVNVRTTTVSTRRQRRAGAGRLRRIAVWDVDMVFPALDKTLDRMNAAQEVFGFELVDISVPLDAWDRTHDTTYLWAERVAERLQGKAAELHVDLLTCVTRHWLRDDEWLNLYLTWPAEGDAPVAIFSTAGHDIEPEGPATDQAIINQMVSLLAGYFANADSHEKGSTGCPLYFDAEREHLVGNKKFDANCRKKLMKTIPQEFPALEALLKLA